MTAHWKLAVWVAGVALLLAVLVPDFSHGVFSILVIQVLVPVAIAGPVTHAVLGRRLRPLAGVGLAVAGVAIHSTVSATLYRMSAGYVAFHDGLTVALLWASAAFKILAVMIVFSVGWILRWRARKIPPASTAL